jgi:hypothetical protein
MADNISLNPGSGGDTVAADEVSGAKYQRVKIVAGADGDAANSGCTTYKKVAAGTSADAANIKALAGVMYGYVAVNTGTADAFLHFYNTASAPTVGTTTSLFDVLLPPDGGVAFSLTHGIQFSTGISVGISTTIGGSTGVTADSVILSVFYV